MKRTIKGYWNYEAKNLPGLKMNPNCKGKHYHNAKLVIKESRVETLKRMINVMRNMEINNAESFNNIISTMETELNTIQTNQNGDIKMKRKIKGFNKFPRIHRNFCLNHYERLAIKYRHAGNAEKAENAWRVYWEIFTEVKTLKSCNVNPAYHNKNHVNKERKETEMKKFDNKHEIYVWFPSSDGAKVGRIDDRVNYYDKAYNGRIYKVYNVQYHNGIRYVQVIGNSGNIGWIPAYTGEEYINGERMRWY